MPPSCTCTAARKPDGYNKVHLQQFGEVLQAWMITQIPGGANGLDQLVCVALGLPRSGWQNPARLSDRVR
jgi:hypothetical protein